MLGLTIYANANSKLDAALFSSPEQRNQPVPSRVIHLYSLFWIHSELLYLFLVHLYRPYRILVIFVRLIFIARDNLDTLIFV